MKSLLVFPRLFSSDSRKKAYRYFFPIGIGYISSVLKSEGYEIDTVNMNHFEKESSKVIHDILEKNRYDIVLLTGTWTAYNETESIINTVRDKSPNTKIVVGGLISTTHPTLMMEHLKPDFGVVGEGEITISELYEYITTGKPDKREIDGLIYFDNGIKINKPREPIHNLDYLPYPDHEGFGYEEYIDNTPSNANWYSSILDYPRFYPITTSRGCTNKCTFCFKTMGNVRRERSINSVIDEIDYAITKYNVNIIDIYDDMFSPNKKRILDFSEGMNKLRKKHKKNVLWKCNMSVNIINDALIKSMKQSGCYNITFGFESMSDEILKSIGKPINTDMIKRTIDIMFDNNMSFTAHFILGDVEETLESMNKTVEFWEDRCLGQVFLTFIYALPDSLIYRNAINKGLIDNEFTYIKRPVPINFSKLTDNEFNNLQDKLNHINEMPPNIGKLKRLNKGKRNTLINECPFCCKVNTHKNIELQSEEGWKVLVICRKCGKRYYLSDLYGK